MRVQPRRAFLIGSAAALAHLAIAPRAFAQSPRLDTVPTVDNLVIRVITDSSYDTPRVGTSKWVKVRRLPPLAGRKGLHNEWGLALVLESHSGSETRDTMLDFGFTPAALMNNLDYMKVDPLKVQALIVSHGHGDHFGGLVGFLEKYRAQLAPDLTVYVGGEDVFCERSRSLAPGGHLTDTGYLDRRDLERLKVRVVTCEKPTVVGHAFTTGWIPRQTFETALGPLPMVQYYSKDGVGCNIAEANAKAQGKPIEDQHIHEHATCFNVKGRGLVVISSCGHAGIINSVRRAMEVTGIRKVHAALGGFHLFPASDEYLRKTMAEFKALDPDVLIPMHCSGPSLIALLRSEMADRVITSTPGTEFTFGA